MCEQEYPAWRNEALYAYLVMTRECLAMDDALQQHRTAVERRLRKLASVACCGAATVERG